MQRAVVCHGARFHRAATGGKTSSVALASARRHDRCAGCDRASRGRDDARRRTPQHAAPTSSSPRLAPRTSRDRAAARHEGSLTQGREPDGDGVRCARRLRHRKGAFGTSTCFAAIPSWCGLGNDRAPRVAGRLAQASCARYFRLDQPRRKRVDADDGNAQKMRIALLRGHRGRRGTPWWRHRTSIMSTC